MAFVSFSDQVLRALHAARTPGWMFPAHLMDVYFEREVSEQGAIALMQIGDHCRDMSGRVSKAAVSLLADVCMAAAVRGYAGKSVRVATVTMRLSFNQLPLHGRLRAVAHVQFLPSDRVVATAIVSVRIEDQAGGVCVTGESTFAALPNKTGTAQHPLPRQSTLHGCLDSAELDETERTVWRRAKACESGGVAALESFWSLPCMPEDVCAGGIRRRIDIGKHNSNRVGHLQGGVLMALLASASEAISRDAFALSDISVQYLEPVVGPYALIEAMPMRLGRNTACIQSAIRNGEEGLLAMAQANLIKAC